MWTFKKTYCMHSPPPIPANTARIYNFRTELRKTKRRKKYIDCVCVSWRRRGVVGKDKFQHKFTILQCELLVLFYRSPVILLSSCQQSPDANKFLHLFVNACMWLNALLKICAHSPYIRKTLPHTYMTLNLHACFRISLIRIWELYPNFFNSAAFHHGL